MSIWSGVELMSVLSNLINRKKGVRLEPGKRTRISRPEYSQELGNSTPRCMYCQQRLEKVDSAKLSPHLTRIQLAAQKLGSVKFVGWQCACPKSSNSIHIRSYIWNSISFLECSQCQEFTIKCSTQTRKEATQDELGKIFITQQCICCGQYKEFQKQTPRLKTVERSTSRGRSGSYSNNQGYGTFADSGGGSSGFSGGGGAGGSW